MKSDLKQAAIILSVALISACSTAPESASEQNLPSTKSASPLEQDAYEQSLSRWTRGDKVYRGIIQKFEVTATILSPEVLNSQIDHEAKLYKWNQQEYAEKRSKVQSDMAAQTKVFVSFFTPVDEDNNLDKSNKVWNVFLLTGSQRVSPAQIKRVYGNMAELKQRFPYHSPWSKGYEMTFPVATESVVGVGGAGANPQFVITGPVGEATLKY